MVSFISYIAPIMAVLGTVRAGFYTTYPVGADAIKSGQTITITWKPDTAEPVLTNVPQYTLSFMTGGNFVQTTVATIGTFDISKQSITYTIPKTAPGMYFLMYTASNGAGSSWSTRFSIDGGTSWYPEGVATGVDPGTSSSVVIASPSASKSTGSDIGEPTIASNTAKPSTTKSEAATSTPVETKETAAETTTAKEPAATSKPVVTKSKTAAAGTTAAEEDTQETTGDAETTEATDDTEQSDLETEVEKSSAHSSSAAPKTTKTSTNTNSAATRYLPMAAALAAAAFML